MDARDLERRTRAAARRLRAEVQSTPYRTLAVAAAAGWVLGGGLPFTLARLVVLNAGRATAANLMAAALRGALDQRR